MPLARALIVSAATLVISTSFGQAGPCLPAVARVQADVDAYLEARAGAGRLAEESTRALMHRQPTPATIAAAEAAVGDLNAATAENVTQAMTRARHFDRAGETSACEQALGDAELAISRPAATRSSNARSR
jgi:hypothetical protein